MKIQIRSYCAIILCVFLNEIEQLYENKIGTRKEKHLKDKL